MINTAKRIGFVSKLASRCVLLCAGGLICSLGWGQTSSLYLQPVEPSVVNHRDGFNNHLSTPISRVSWTAVRLPEPRAFALHDLITIIVRESIENDSETEIDTEKNVDLNGVIAAFPNLNVSDLLQLKLGPSAMDKGLPRVDVQFDNSFSGEGDVSRKDTFTTRITSRIIDIKPNGTLVLEARKRIRNDEEEVEMSLTGTCRKEDVTADNSILSTQLYDLNLVKEHAGELRDTVKKGWITEFFDAIFNF